MHRGGSEEGVRGQANFPFAGILLRVGFWLMDREICTSISGYKGSPRELMLTLAYLTGQGWKALVLGHGEGGGLEEGRRPPGLSSPIRFANSALPATGAAAVVLLLAAYGAQVHAHLTLWASPSPSLGWGQGPGALPRAW